MALTQLELYGWQGLHVDSWAAWTLLARNLLLVTLLLVVARELERARTAHDPRDVSCELSSESRRARRSATSCARRTLSSVRRERTVE